MHSQSAAVRKKVGGFTLIELLVCVAIIALLLALLMPALSRARAMAVTTKCLSNLKSIGIGFGEYRSEWNNFLPPEDAVAAHVGGTLGVTPWCFTKDYMMYQSINPYIGTQSTGTFSGGRVNATKWYWGSIGDNPAAPQDFDEAFIKGWQVGTIWVDPDPRDTFLSYPQYDVPMANGYLESEYLVYPGGGKSESNMYITGETTALVRPYNQIPNPALSIQVGEMTLAGGKAGGATPKSLGTTAAVKALDPGTPRTDQGFDLWRHNMAKGCNLLFADGHAGYYTADYVVKNITYDTNDIYAMDNFQLP